MKKEPLKNIDSPARSRFLKVTSYTVPPLFILGVVMGVKIFWSFKLGLILGGTAGILVAVVCHVIIERLGSFGGNIIYGNECRHIISGRVSAFRSPGPFAFGPQ